MTTLDFSTIDFITELFCRVDDALPKAKKHTQATLHSSETITLGLLFALKGVGNRAFYRWISRDLRGLFPHLPERTRLFRLLARHQNKTACFLAEPTLLGVADSFGIELLHPWRLGRSDKQIGKKGHSNHRWIVGGKLGVVLNRFGLVCAWDCTTANAHDSIFQPLIKQFDGQMLVLADTHFHKKAGDPPNLKVCGRGVWNDRMVIETVLSMLQACVILSASGIGSGVTLRHGWRLRWPFSISASSGTAYRQTRTASCRFRWRSSAYKTSTIG